MGKGLIVAIIFLFFTQVIPILVHKNEMSAYKSMSALEVPNYTRKK